MHLITGNASVITRMSFYDSQNHHKKVLGTKGNLKNKGFVEIEMS